MANLALVSVATVAFLLFVNAHAQTQEQPVRNVIDAIEQYYRTRLTGDRTGVPPSRFGGRGDGRVDGRVEGGTGRPSQEWDWEWDTAGEREGEMEVGEGGDTRRSPIDRITTMLEDLQMKLFLDDIRDTSRGYQDMCPRLMDLLERGFMRQWMTSYMQRLRGESERSEGRTERPRDWSAELTRVLRRQPTTDARDTRGERGERTWREEEFQPEAERTTTTQSQLTSSMWQGLMASCYVYTDLIHGNAPRLETWGRTGQQ